MTKRNFVIIKLQADEGGGKPGSRAGAEMILKAADDRGLSSIAGIPAKSLSFNGASASASTPFAKSIDAIVAYQREVAASLQEASGKGLFPVVLSGDHSSGAAVIAGLKSGMPHEKLGVIWIDAHADLHSPFTTPSGNLHGMPLAAAMCEDNRESGSHVLDEKTSDGWENWKELASPNGPLQGDQIVFVGLRSTESPEDYLIAKHNIASFSVATCRQKGFDRVCAEILDRLASCQKIFLSFDVDCLDPSVSVATGTPVDDGFLLDEGKALVQHIMKDPRVVCLEITEVNPILEEGDAMASAAASILDTALQNHA